MQKGTPTELDILLEGRLCSVQVKIYFSGLYVHVQQMQGLLFVQTPMTLPGRGLHSID